MLFVLWLEEDHRPTQDLDLLGIGDFSADSLRTMFEEVCTIPVEDDGVEFIREKIAIEEIREAMIYQGLRVRIPGRLGGIKLNVLVDVGFGDTVVPRPKKETYPVLLDLPHPKLKICPKETVVAEKLDAMILLGLRNSRMKDYFDLWMLAKHFHFDAALLAEAINATLERRGRRLPTREFPGLEDRFADDATKQTQWKAFLRRTVPYHRELELRDVVCVIREFLSPVLDAVISKRPLDWQWAPERGWTDGME